LGTVVAIAQTTDGYMWLATPTELLRFDGVRRVPVRLATGATFDEGARALKGARDGSLWIGTSRGLFVFRNGSVQTEALLSGMTVNAIDEDPDGTIWAAGAADGKGALCTIRKSGSECHGQDGRLGAEIVALYRDSASAFWVVGVDHVWKWGSEPMVSFALPARADVVRSVTEMADGVIVIGLRGQVARIAEGRMETLPLPGWTRDLAFDKALRARDGALWLGTADTGLLYLHEGRLTTYATPDGLSGDKILDLFEDREGNVWVSTSRGLDQFRPIALVNQSGLNGLKGRARAVLSTRDGSMWASTTTGIYERDSSNTWQSRRSWLDGVGSLFEDHRSRIWAPSQTGVQYFDGNRFVDAIGIPPGAIDAMAEDTNGDLWLAHRELGLLRVQTDGKAKFAATVVLKPSSRVSTLTIDPVDRSLWIGLWSGALEHLQDGQLLRGPALLGGPTATSRITHVRGDPDGTLWLSTFAGLFRIAHGRVARLNLDRGLPCDRLLFSFADEKSFWLNAQCGLIRVDRADADAWTDAADKGIRKKATSQLVNTWDGVDQGIAGRSIGSINPTYNYTPKFARSADGRLWVVTGDSLVTMDPERIPNNKLPPPVHVEQLVSDGAYYGPRASLALPPLQRDVRIDYTGLSFTVPEEMKFRYKLEGRDADWQDAGQRRQAFYTDLSPGTYRFRVIAANSDGVWNSEGDTLEFLIQPAWWQTLTFRAACVGALVLLLLGLHRLRLAQLSRRFDSSLEARVNERMRIARELHDTLLQTFQGHVLRLQTALQLWPSRDGRLILEDGIDQAAEAITEGRDAVQGLRSGGSEAIDMAGAIRALGQVLATDPAFAEAKFDVEVQGRPRALHPIVRDDAFRIAGEALRNAFRHAEPKRVEVEIRYGERELKVIVRDDGRGMDRSVVRRGREGHFGLHGMRERAQLIGGKLTFRSRVNAGTEVELTVPAARAYEAVDHEVPSHG
jgi:signal transduction histidine kinase/ligand-binding sensor domain-containing protein